MAKLRNKLFSWALGVFLLGGGLFLMIQVRDRPSSYGFVESLQVERQKVVEKAKYKTLDHFMPSFDSLWTVIQHPKQKKEVALESHIAYYEKIIELFGQKYPESYALLGFCYYHSGQTKKAKEALEALYRLQPSFYWASFNLGVLALNEGQFQSAVRYFNEAIQQNPQFAFHLIGQSYIYIQILQSGDSTYSLEKSYSDSYKSSLFGLGISLRVLGLEQKAKQVFEQLHQMDPDFTEQDVQFSVKIF